MINSLADLLSAQYGVQTQEVENIGETSIGLTAVRIAPNNPRRVSLIFTNTGTTTIYIGLNPYVSSTSGIWLPPGGSSLSYRWDIDMSLITREFWALSSAAGGTLYSLSVDILAGTR